MDCYRERKGESEHYCATQRYKIIAHKTRSGDHGHHLVGP